MNAYSLSGLGDGEGVARGVSAGAGVVASAAAGGTLTAIGISAQAIPVVGQIAGAVAFLAAGIAKLIGGRKIAKQLNKQAKQYDNALKAIKKENENADLLIASTAQQIATVKADLSKVGLSGLGASWFQKTFLPKKTAEKNLKKVVANYNKKFPEYEAELNQKIAQLESMKRELEGLQLLAKYGKPAVAGGAILGVAALLFILGNAFNKPKAEQKKKAA